MDNLKLKKIIITLCALCAFVECSNAQQTFNVFTYAEPKGFTKEVISIRH
jgi:hypothetical protein